MEDEQGTVVFKYVATLENLSYNTKKDDKDFLKSLQTKEENPNIKLYPIDMADTKHFREW